MEFNSLDSDNIKHVYELFQRNKVTSLIPFEYFKKGTLEDSDFDPEMTLVLENKDKKQIIATFIAIIRSTQLGMYCYLKACLVDRKFQRQGIGTQMLEELLSRARSKDSKLTSYGDSVPNYWEPGVDLRHTSLYYFLKKHKFRSLRMRQNLNVKLKKMEINPKTHYGEYFYERVRRNDFNNLFNFVKEHFPDGTWAEEVALSFVYNPPTTFVAKDDKSNIIGWSSHSQLFPGSFGPTGVLQSLRRKGIGTELLKWALWDIKQNDITKATIMWVEGDNVKYYSKTIGAYIFPVFIPMQFKFS